MSALYYRDAQVQLYCGDALTLLPRLRRDWRAACAIVDPPYGQTNLPWDRWVAGWATQLPTSSLWCFGSFRLFRDHAAEFADWAFAQDLIWHKHNGSSMTADRFRRVHETIAHFYRGKWRDVYHHPVMTLDARKRQVRRTQRPPHWGDIGAAVYTATDGGPRYQRSVIAVRSEHGRAIHPTQKPIGILQPLIEYSVPPGGWVLDPFAGSGSTLVAAVRAGRRAVGIEINPTYCADIVARLRAAA